MKLHKNQKKVKLGVQLLVSFDQGKRFTLIGGFFNCRRDAENYRNQNYPTLPFRTQGLRMSCTRVGRSKDSNDFQTRHREAITAAGNKVA